MKNPFASTLALLSVIYLPVTASPLFAQTASQAEDESAQPQASVEGEAVRLDPLEVTAERAVTATKTETPLKDTPQAISVVPSKLFHERGALNLQETLRYSAGVTAESFGLDTRSENFFVRGLFPVEYQDGLRKVFNFQPLPRTDVNTFERVEVLRGPSSVLYGQGSSGGIVNAISKMPQFTPAGRLSVEYGSFDRKQAVADYTGALNDAGTVAGRVTAVLRDAGMQTDKIEDDRVVLQPSITWQAENDTQITLLGQYQKDRTASSQQFLPVVATLQAPEGRRAELDTFLGDEDFDRLDARQLSGLLKIEHWFGDAHALRSTTRYVDADTEFLEIFPDVFSNPKDPFIDDDNRILNRNAFGTKPRINILTTDNAAELNFATGPLAHQLLAGVDYTNFDQSSSSASGQVTPIDLFNPVSEGVVFPEFQADPDQQNTQLGFYLQDQVHYGDRLSLIAGVRRDRAESKTESSPEQVDEETSWRLGVIGELIPGVSPYVSYSESFLPVEGLDFDDEPLKPVIGEQWELGIKWEPVRGAWVTVTAYTIEETNQPINDPENVLGLVQIGKVRSRGIEVEGSYELPGDFLVTAAYSYNEAETVRSLFDFEVGEQLNDVPKELASLWLAKRFPIRHEQSLLISLGARFVGSTQSIGVADPQNPVRTPSYSLVDASVEYEFGEWQASLTATNLLDKEYFAPCRAFGDCFTGNGRNVVASVTYRW